MIDRRAVQSRLMAETKYDTFVGCFNVGPAWVTLIQYCGVTEITSHVRNTKHFQNIDGNLTKKVRGQVWHFHSRGWSIIAGEISWSRDDLWHDLVNVLFHGSRPPWEWTFKVARNPRGETSPGSRTHTQDLWIGEFWEAGLCIPQRQRWKSTPSMGQRWATVKDGGPLLTHSWTPDPFTGAVTSSHWEKRARRADRAYVIRQDGGQIHHGETRRFCLRLFALLQSKLYDWWKLASRSPGLPGDFSALSPSS